VTFSDFVRNLMLTLTVKEFRKSTSILQSYGTKQYQYHSDIFSSFGFVHKNKKNGYNSQSREKSSRKI